MGASASSIKAAEQPAAESLLTAFKNLSATERRRHASVLNYWLSVRGDREFPPLHDLDPLELSDAGANSILLELISGGHDAEIRHLGEALREEAWPERIIDAPSPSVLSCIAKKLPIVAISRDFLAFEDEYESSTGEVRCSVTLLPLSAGGAWVDYVYALVSVEQVSAKSKSGETAKKGKPTSADLDEHANRAMDEVPDEKLVAQVEEASSKAVDDEDAQPADQPAVQESDEAKLALEESEVEAGNAHQMPHAEELLSDSQSAAEHPDQAAPPEDTEVVAPSDNDDQNAVEAVATPAPKAAPGFSKLLDSLAGLTGFYGSQPVKVEPAVKESAAGEDQEPGQLEGEEGKDRRSTPGDETVGTACAKEPEQAPQVEPSPAHVDSVTLEGSLQNKLTQVRAKADEARMARLRAETVLCEGLGAAYDFALDAEEAPEEYLRLVEAQGLKIQLRSPMKPVVKLAFAGACDEPTIKQLEAVLAWAFEQELPRGTLPERIEAAGGIGSILKEQARAA